MKTAFEIVAFIFICFRRCTTTFCEDDTLNLNEETDMDLLYFSFDKKTFDNFKCNVSNELLNHSSMYKPQFFKSESTRNFLSTLCLFIQYSELKKNDLFRNEIEELFKMYAKSLHYLNDNDIKDFVYDPDTFKDRLIRLDDTIKGILEEQDFSKQIVWVKEEDGRYIITQKCSTNNTRHKIVEEGIKKFTVEYKSDKVLIARCNFEIKMYEYFLEGLLGENYRKVSKSIYKKCIEIFDDPNFNECSFLEKTDDTTNPENKLFRLFYEFDKLPISQNSFEFNSHAENTESDQETINNLFLLDHKLAARRLISGNIPEYLYDLTFKNRVKVLFAISKNPNGDLDTFSQYPRHYIDSCLMIKKMLNECLRDPRKIIFYCQLSDESINNLVKICLELVL